MLDPPRETVYDVSNGRECVRAGCPLQHGVSGRAGAVALPVRNQQLGFGKEAEKIHK